MKKIILILVLFLSFGLWNTERIVNANTEEGIYYQYNNGGYYLDETTVPNGQIMMGTTGQIRPKQDSLIKDMQYAFLYKVSDPSVLSVDERGNWQALKEGTITITIRVPYQDGNFPNFEEELDQLGIKRAPNETTVAYAPKIFTVTVSSNSTIPMYRLYNPNNKEHFYTASKNERDTLVRIGWGKYEGVAWRAPKEGREVYRLYNPILKDHHYTMDQNEVKVLTTKHHWRNEGVAWYSDGSRPVYRLFHQGLTSGSHHYTMSENEVRVLQTRGWRYEGTAWYGEYEEVFE